METVNKGYKELTTNLGIFQRNSMGKKNAYKSDFNFFLIKLSFWVFWLPLTHFILQTTRVKSNMFEKMQAGNFIKNLKEKNYIKK